MNDQVKRPFLTHASGAPVTDNVNIMTGRVARRYFRTSG
jgi:hypothetical protein